MRLLHKDLIPVLPRQQLLGQWRELCAIMRNIETDGTPNHVLVNKVIAYEERHLFTYAKYIQDEMEERGYKCNLSKFAESYQRNTEEKWVTFVYKDDLFSGCMNDSYLIQCYYNLQEKYDCGAITNKEWQKVEELCRELIGDVL